MSPLVSHQVWLGLDVLSFANRLLSAFPGLLAAAVVCLVLGVVLYVRDRRQKRGAHQPQVQAYSDLNSEESSDEEDIFYTQPPVPALETSLPVTAMPLATDMVAVGLGSDDEEDALSVTVVEPLLPQTNV